jgi:predicted RNA-binding protein YlxR (DUF448 family)
MSEEGRDRHQERRCVVCRGRELQSELLRFGFKEGRFFFDKLREHRARGAYLHRQYACWMKANEIGYWIRSLQLTSSKRKESRLKKGRLQQRSGSGVDQVEGQLPSGGASPFRIDPGEVRAALAIARGELADLVADDRGAGDGKSPTSSGKRKVRI